MNTLKIKSVQFLENFNANHRKENHFMEQYTALVLTKDGMREAVTLRVYGTRAMNYVCLWFNNGDQWASGTGSAGGYGYHRPSAAAAEAFKKAGVELSERINGQGDEIIREAVEALAKKLYPRKKVYIHKAHA